MTGADRIYALDANSVGAPQSQMELRLTRFAIGESQAMQRCNHSVFALAAISIAFWFPFSDARAVTCDVIGMTVELSRTELQRSANESDFHAARKYARRAMNFLSQAAMSAMDCQCDMAFMQFNVATSHARRAADSYAQEEFLDQLSRAIRAFNSALLFLKECASRRN